MLRATRQLAIRAIHCQQALASAGPASAVAQPLAGLSRHFASEGGELKKTVLHDLHVQQGGNNVSCLHALVYSSFGSPSLLLSPAPAASPPALVMVTAQARWWTLLAGLCPFSTRTALWMPLCTAAPTPRCLTCPTCVDSL